MRLFTPVSYLGFRINRVSVRLRMKKKVYSVVRIHRQNGKTLSTVIAEFPTHEWASHYMKNCYQCLETAPLELDVRFQVREF